MTGGPAPAPAAPPAPLASTPAASPSPLEQLARAHPELRRAADVLAALAGAVAEGAAEWTGGDRLDDDVLAARLDGGVPALTGEQLLGGAELLERARRVGAALERAGGSAADAARAVVAALDAAAANADMLAAHALAGEWDAARDLARRLDVDEDALVTVLDYAVRGALRGANVRVRALLDRRAASDGVGARSWERGVCPACGAPPALAELRGGKEQSRTLRCARCDGAWAFPRLACPACGERDHRKLVALSGEGEESYRRADCCDTCGTYVKAVATLSPLSPDALMETDLATAALDMVAIERGYHR